MKIRDHSPTRLKEMRGAITKQVVRRSKIEREVHHHCCPNHSSINPLCRNPIVHVPASTSPVPRRLKKKIKKIH